MSSAFKDQATAEAAAVRALGDHIGYGRVMQLAEQIWSSKDPIGAKTVGTAVCFLVPCPHPEDGRDANGHCDWCCGSGRVTKKVLEAMSTMKRADLLGRALSKRPVAYRVNTSIGPVFLEDEADANRDAETLGCTYDGLYARDGERLIGPGYEIVPTRLTDEQVEAALNPADEVELSLQDLTRGGIRRAKFRAQFRALLQHLLGAGTKRPYPDWQPFSDVPRDGSWIIARCNDHSAVYHVYWDVGEECWTGFSASYGDGLFMPHGDWIPAPPHLVKRADGVLA